MGHFPSASSIKALLHYGQSARDNSFKAFDYGSDSVNKLHYGTRDPPLYPLEKITEVPTAMFVGIEDELGDPTDCEDAKMSISAGGDALVHYEEMHAGHASFLIGKDMTYFTDRAMGLIKKYNPL